MAVNPTSTRLAIGCEDGFIRILNISDGQFAHSFRLERCKARPLSISWGTPVLKRRRISDGDADADTDEDEDEGWEDNWLVAGCSDSCLRKWMVGSRRMDGRMATDKLRGQRTLVWAVAALR